jgi:hypothetical protein
MDSQETQPRSILAYAVARRLIYYRAGNGLNSSPVRAARDKLDELLSNGDLPESEHRELSSLLLDLENCDMDRCERVDDLVTEVTRNLAAWPEEFPTQELERLRELV